MASLRSADLSNEDVYMTPYYPLTTSCQDEIAQIRVALKGCLCHIQYQITNILVKKYPVSDVWHNDYIYWDKLVHKPYVQSIIQEQIDRNLWYGHIEIPNAEEFLELIRKKSKRFDAEVSKMEKKDGRNAD